MTALSDTASVPLTLLLKAQRRLLGATGVAKPAEAPLPPSERPAGQPSIERAVLAIMREAQTNVRKHATASRLSVELVEERDEPHLSVRDDGVGRGIARAVVVADGAPFGLEQMRELAGEPE